MPPPAYHRTQGRLGPAPHIDALTLVRTLHLLTLCRLAVRLAHHRCPPPLPAGPGGSPLRYSEASLLLIALLRTLWRLSYQDMQDWLAAWPALALACGLPLDRVGQPRIPSASQQWKRAARAGAPIYEALFVLSVLSAIRRRLIEARDLIIDSAPILAWCRTDPDAAVGHAPAQHPRPLLRGYRVHTLLCAGTVALIGAVIGWLSVAGIVIGIGWFSIDSVLSGLVLLASLSNATVFIQARLTSMAMGSNSVAEYPILHSVFSTSYEMAHLFLLASIQEDAPRVPMVGAYSYPSPIWSAAASCLSSSQRTAASCLSSSQRSSCWAGIGRER